MSQSDPNLWKQAYRKQFGTDPDQDMAEHAEDVEQWRISWQGGYDAGEQWAKDLLGESSGGGGATQGSMRTFADMSQMNPNIRQQYDTWREERASQGQDSTDWDEFRSYVQSIGAPDPGARPPDDFVGDDWKQQHPEWVARYGNRAA